MNAVASFTVRLSCVAKASGFVKNCFRLFVVQPGQSQPEAAPAPEKAEAVPDNVMTVAKDQRYARYLKMVQVVRCYVILLLKKTFIKENVFLKQIFLILCLSREYRQWLFVIKCLWKVWIQTCSSRFYFLTRKSQIDSFLPNKLEFNNILPTTAHLMRRCLMEQQVAQRMRTFLPPALTASRRSVTDLCLCTAPRSRPFVATCSSCRLVAAAGL